MMRGRGNFSKGLHYNLLNLISESVETEEGCLLAPKRRSLRGDMWVNPLRFAYELMRGEIPAGHALRHTCPNVARGDNPKNVCINPDHLRVVRWVPKHERLKALASKRPTRRSSDLGGWL
jgi:hypothetical protein